MQSDLNIVKEIKFSFLFHAFVRKLPNVPIEYRLIMFVLVGTPG